MTVLEMLGEMVAGAVPDAAEHRRVGFHLIDAIGAWLAADAAEEGLRIRGFSQGNGRPAVLDDGPLDEIVRRVAVTRSSEIDDIHLPSCTTAGALIVPTALVLAGTCDPAPDDVAAAIRAGYDVAIRLGTAIDGAHILYRGVWPTYLVAPVVTAAVAARILRLDPAATADALAMALTAISGGIGRPPDHLTRFLQGGFAARTGVTAALAAAEGVAADRSLLDEDWLTHVHGIVLDRAALGTSDKSDAMHRLSMKPWCAAKQTIAAIDGFRQIMRGHEPDSIVAVRVAVPPPYQPMVGHRNDSSRVGRITSLPYQLALAAVRPAALIDVIRSDYSADPHMAAVMARINVEAEPDLLEYFPTSWPARVQVTFAGGTDERILVTQAEGDPDRPLDESAVAAKFTALAAPVVGPAEASAWLEDCRAALNSRVGLRTLLARLDNMASRRHGGSSVSTRTAAGSRPATI